MSPLAPAGHAALAAPDPQRLAELLEATAPRQADPAARTDGQLPVPDALAPLFPAGALERGSVTEAADIGVLLALAGAAIQHPERIPELTGWVAAIGIPELGLLAATGYGIDPARLLLVDRPGDRWPEVVAALAPSVDVILLRPPDPVTPTVARRLGAHLRRGSAAVLTPVTWPGSTLRLQISASTWVGLGAGHGLLCGRQVTVEASGRGRAAVPGRTARVWLPDADGRVRAVETHESVKLPHRGARIEPPGQRPQLRASAG